MISITSVKLNTMEKEKQETAAQDYSDTKSGKEPNPDLETLNEQISALSAKNAELTVSNKFIHYLYEFY